MTAEKQSPASKFQQRVNAEIQDNLDEDIELELEDDQLADVIASNLASHGHPTAGIGWTSDRRTAKRLLRRAAVLGPTPRT